MFFKILSLSLLLGIAIGQDSRPVSVSVVGDAIKYVELDDNFNMSCVFRISFSPQTGVDSYTSFVDNPTVKIKWKAVHSGLNNPPFSTMVGQWPMATFPSTGTGFYVDPNVGDMETRIQTGNATITSTAEDEQLVGQSWMQINNISIDDESMNPIECLASTTTGTAEHYSRLTFNVYARPTVIVMPGIGQSTDQRAPIVEVPTTTPSNNATEPSVEDESEEDMGAGEGEAETGTEEDAGATGDNNTDDFDGNNEDGISRRRRQAEGEVEVAICNVERIYPAIESVTFAVGETDNVVPVSVQRENEDGTYSYDVSLFLAVNPELNGQAVSCTANVQTGIDYNENIRSPQEEDVIIEVLYDTTEINIAINGDSTSPQDMNTHTTFTITCSADGNPQPEAYEILLGNVEDENVIGNSQVMDYELADSGSNEPTYITCRTYNRNNVAIDSLSMELTATYIGQASISNAGESMEHNVGDNMDFTCVAANSNPPASFQWKYRNDDDEEETVIDTIDGVLQLSNLQFADSGRYTCEASNSAGSTSASVELNIVGKCSAKLKTIIGQAMHQPPDSTTKTGHVRLDCYTYGNPPCHVEFQPKEHVGKTTNDYENMDDGGVKWSVTYDNFVKLSSPFNVSCTAENEHGKVTSNVELVDDEAVVEPPATPTGLSTGVIILIIIIVVIVVVGVPVGCYYVQRRKKSSSKSINAKEADLESTNEEDEREKLNANSEESLPPPPSDMHDERFGQDMTTFSTQK